MRTCVGCRRIDIQAALLRVVVQRGRAVADPRRRLSGRGAYVHRTLGCVEQAGKGLSRSLRTAVAARDLVALRAVIADGDPGRQLAGHGDRDVVEDPPPHKA